MVSPDATLWPQQVQRQYKRQRRGAIAPNSQEALLCAIAAREYSQETADKEAQEGADILRAMGEISLRGCPPSIPTLLDTGNKAPARENESST